MLSGHFFKMVGVLSDAEKVDGSMKVGVRYSFLAGNFPQVEFDTPFWRVQVGFDTPF